MKKILLVILLILVGLIVWRHYNPKTPPQTPSDPHETVAEDILSEVYTDTTRHITLKYPAGYTLDTTYTYTALGPNNTISGIQLTIPASLHTGTNLSQDSYIAVEQLPSSDTASHCSADMFLDPQLSTNPLSLTEDGISYSIASSTDAGAGNRYENIVYALTDTYPCTAVRYFIHYSALENYPEGTVSAFDRDALLSQFNTIRRALTLSQ